MFLEIVAQQCDTMTRANQQGMFHQAAGLQYQVSSADEINHKSVAMHTEHLLSAASSEKAVLQQHAQAPPVFLFIV
jgi:hypothetical protein